jgi:1,2-diacylglycerol 3-alpha-glucosyltransferase
VLAHNAEAALIALAARRVTGVPVVYVAHTLLQHELSAYLPERLAHEANRAGQQIERAIARRADGIIALCEATQKALSPHARVPLALIPPSFEIEPAPEARAQAEACQRHGLIPGRYTLYSGNLDRYQELDLLAHAASRLPPGADPLVVATHAFQASEQPSPDGSGLHRVRVRDFEEMRQLIHAAGCLVAPRRRAGGFPIKLLNYMEAGRPIVAFSPAAPGLEADQSAWLIPESSPGLRAEKELRGEALAHALTSLSADPELGRRLGAGARRQLETRHPGHRIARETLDYLAELSGSIGRPHSRPRRC